MDTYSGYSFEWYIWLGQEAIYKKRAELNVIYAGESKRIPKRIRDMTGLKEDQKFGTYERYVVIMVREG